MHVYLVAYYLYTKVPSIYLCSLAGMLRSTTTSAKRVRPKPLLMIRETLSRRRRDQRFPKPRLSRLLLSVSEGHMTAHTIFSWNTVWPGHAVRGGILCTPDVPHVIALSLALSTCNWRCSVWFKTVYFMSICSLMLDPNPKWIAGVLRRMSCSWNFQPTWSTSLCGRHRKKGLEQLLWWVEILPCAEVPSSKRNCSQLDILYIYSSYDNPLYPLIHLTLHLGPATPGRSPGHTIRTFAKRIGEGVRGPTNLFSFRSSGWSACMTPTMRNNTGMM